MFCEQCYHHYDWKQAEKVQAPRSEAIDLERSGREDELSRQEYERHFQQLATEASNDPCHNFLAYITYNPVDEELEEPDYEDPDDAELDPPKEECEMDALRAAGHAQSK
jgi:hypothetical protein